MDAVLLITLALAFYNVGTIWAHEVDIFRSWQYVGDNFRQIQDVHWRKLPYWVLAPVVLALAASIALFWFHPVGLPIWGIVAYFGAQLLSAILTAFYWGPWQAKLSRDPAGAQSLYLRNILRTHWIRTALITSAAIALLASTIVLFSHAR